MNHIRQNIRTTLATMILLMSFQVSGLNALQITSIGEFCHILETEYEHLASNFAWLDANSVVFRVWDGLAPGGIVEPRYLWYRYDADLSSLQVSSLNPLERTILNAEQLAALIDLDLSHDAAHSLIEVSPSGESFIYPRLEGEASEFWYVDIQSGLEVNLEISNRGSIDLKALWSADEQSLLVYDNITANNDIRPAQLITIRGTEVSIQPLGAIPLLANRGLRYHPFRVRGFSSDGRYIAFDPQLPPYNGWIVDLRANEIIETPFSFRGRSNVVWTGDLTFLTLSDLGLIQYDIPSHNFEILSMVDQLAPIGVSGSLSPDGQHLIGEWYIKDANSVITARGFAVCNLAAFG